MDENDKAQTQGDLGDVSQKFRFPTINLPSGPGVDFPQGVERGPRIKRMIIEGRATDPGNVEKADLPLQESRDRGLVGCIERGPRGPSRVSSLRYPKSKLGKRLPVGRLEVEGKGLTQIEPLSGKAPGTRAG